MTALAQNNSVTIGLSDESRVVLSTNGGIGGYIITTTGGATSSSVFGPGPLRQVLGPYSKGATVTVTNINCNSLDYDYGIVNQASVFLTGGIINGASIGATVPASGAFTTITATTSINPTTNGVVPLGAANVGYSKLYMDFTNSGTVGAVTINKAAGRVNIAALGASVVVTNSLCTAASHVFGNLANADTTAKSAQVTPGAGSFTINLNAVATAQVAIDFFIVNAD